MKHHVTLPKSPKCFFKPSTASKPFTLHHLTRQRGPCSFTSCHSARSPRTTWAPRSPVAATRRQAAPESGQRPTTESSASKHLAVGTWSEKGPTPSSGYKLYKNVKLPMLAQELCILKNSYCFEVQRQTLGPTLQAWEWQAYGARHGGVKWRVSICRTKNAGGFLRSARSPCGQDAQYGTLGWVLTF